MNLKHFYMYICLHLYFHFSEQYSEIHLNSEVIQLRWTYLCLLGHSFPDHRIKYLNDHSDIVLMYNVWIFVKLNCIVSQSRIELLLCLKYRAKTKIITFADVIISQTLHTLKTTAFLRFFDIKVSGVFVQFFQSSIFNMRCILVTVWIEHVYFTSNFRIFLNTFDISWIEASQMKKIHIYAILFNECFHPCIELFLSNFWHLEDMATMFNTKLETPLDYHECVSRSWTVNIAIYIISYFGSQFYT